MKGGSRGDRKGEEGRGEKFLVGTAGGVLSWLSGL